MKKTLVTVVAVGAVVAMAGAASAVITGSKHDFNFSIAGYTGILTGLGYTYNNQICTPCHAPHGNINAAGTLLWNHAASTVAAFTPYDSPSMDAAPPGAASVATMQCMSCHDGSTALDSFAGNVGGTFIGAGALVGAGGNFAQDHPIGIPYTFPESTAGLNDPATTAYGAAGLFIANYLEGGTNVECWSCHDVHNQGTAVAKLLVEDNFNSTMCLKCHIK